MRFFLILIFISIPILVVPDRWNMMKAALCEDEKCQCQMMDLTEDSASGMDDEHDRNEKLRRKEIKAICQVDIVNDRFGEMLEKSPAVNVLVFSHSSQSNTNASQFVSVEKQSTLPWKMITRKIPLKILDLSSIELSCDCENSWLAFWYHSNFSLIEPLVKREVLLSLTSRKWRHINSKPPGPEYFPIVNEEPSCPYNCSLTVAELFRLPQRIVFNPKYVSHSNSGPFSHCLHDGLNQPHFYFAQKCGLTRLTMDTEKMIRNETDPMSVTCSRIQISNFGGKKNAESKLCPELRLSPFMRTGNKNDTNENEMKDGIGNRTQWQSGKKQRSFFIARCLDEDTTIGEKLSSSRNESGWILCKDENEYLPQAALAPFIVSGPPQIVDFREDQQGEQVHFTFYIVGYPKPRLGWHKLTEGRWYSPNEEKGLDVILASRPSFGHYIISGRATFSELSMMCFKGNYHFQVCNDYGCDKKQFTIHQGVPLPACPSGDSQPGLFDSPPIGLPPVDQSLSVEKSMELGLIDENTDQPEDKFTLLFHASSVSPSSHVNHDENWAYIAVPFLVVFAVVVVGVLTTCLFLRLVGGAVNNCRRGRKLSSERHKNRPSLSEWELSPLNGQNLHSFEINSHYVDWLHHVKARVRVFPSSDLTIIKELGEGAFGRVLLIRAVFHDQHENMSSSQNNGKPNDDESASSSVRKISQPAYYAMKLLKNVTAEKLEDLEREAAIMSQLDHPNIVLFYGLSSNTDALALLFEYMENGDLVNYLRNHSAEVGTCPNPLHWNDLLVMALQIAKGLEYLADRHLVHRDLAARNCLVGKNMVVKISDFGMTRDIYITDYYKMGTHTLVPLRWLPPESILYRKFTVESDIWSFGVLLWEIFSYGKIPWFMYSNSEVLQIIQDGRLLERPEGSLEEVHSEIMLKCWTRQPFERLTAKSAREKLEEIIETRIRYCNIFPSCSDIAQCSRDVLENINESQISVHAPVCEN